MRELSPSYRTQSSACECNLSVFISTNHSIQKNQHTMFMPHQLLVIAAIVVIVVHFTTQGSSGNEVLASGTLPTSDNSTTTTTPTPGGSTSQQPTTTKLEGALRFNADGTFKIVQFTDMHYGEDPTSDASTTQVCFTYEIS